MENNFFNTVETSVGTAIVEAGVIGDVGVEIESRLDIMLITIKNRGTRWYKSIPYHEWAPFYVQGYDARVFINDFIIKPYRRFILNRYIDNDKTLDYTKGIDHESRRPYKEYKNQTNRYSDHRQNGCEN